MKDLMEFKESPTEKIQKNTTIKDNISLVKSIE